MKWFLARWWLPFAGLVVSFLIWFATYVMLDKDEARVAFSTFLLVPTGVLLPIIGFMLASHDARSTRLDNAIDPIRRHIEVLSPAELERSQSELEILMTRLSLNKDPTVSALVGNLLQQVMQNFAHHRKAAVADPQDVRNVHQTILEAWLELRTKQRLVIVGGVWDRLELPLTFRGQVEIDAASISHCIFGSAHIVAIKDVSDAVHTDFSECKFEERIPIRNCRFSDDIIKPRTDSELRNFEEACKRDRSTSSALNPASVGPKPKRGINAGSSSRSQTSSQHQSP